MREESRTVPNVHNKPSASKIHPTQLRGRLEATSAPTRGKARKGKKLTTLPTAPRVLHSPGESIDRASTCKAMAATNMITESAASDQASQEAAFRLLAPRPDPSLVPSVTTPLYSMNVSGSLRRPLRTSLSERGSTSASKMNLRGIKRCMLVSLRSGADFSRGCASQHHDRLSL